MGAGLKEVMVAGQRTSCSQDRDLRVHRTEDFVLTGQRTSCSQDRGTSIHIKVAEMVCRAVKCTSNEDKLAVLMGLIKQSRSCMFVRSGDAGAQTAPANTQLLRVNLVWRQALELV